MRTDRQWEKWGATDPYYGVFSNNKFHAKNLTDQVWREFFESGEDHVDRILGTISNVFSPIKNPRTVLDFGSGVGRLVIPFALRVEGVVGVDISTSMIEEATNNCHKFGIKNASFLKSDDQLSLVVEKYDLVHSYVVLQHIPWSRGKAIFAGLAARVKDGGTLPSNFSLDAMLLLRCEY